MQKRAQSKHQTTMGKSLSMLKMESFSKLDLRINQHASPMSQSSKRLRLLLEHQAFSPEDSLHPAQTQAEQDDQPHNRSIGKQRLMAAVDYLDMDRFQGLSDVQRLKKDRHKENITTKNKGLKQLLHNGRQLKSQQNRSWAYLKQKEKAVADLNVTQLVDGLIAQDDSGGKNKEDMHRLKVNSLQNQIDNLKGQAQEMKSQLDIQQQINRQLKDDLFSLQQEQTRLIKEQQSYEQFSQIQKDMRTHGGDYVLSIQELLKNNKTLQNLSIAQQDTINTLQEKNSKLHRQIDTLRQKASTEMQAQVVPTGVRAEDMLLQQKEEQIKELEQFRSQLLAVHNKVMGMFLRWSQHQKIFYDLDSLDNTNQLNDCLQVLAVMEQMVKLDSNERLQAYLRKIMVSTNQLQKKWLPQHIDEQYQPDLLYSRLNALLQQQDNTITSLRKER